MNFERTKKSQIFPLNESTDGGYSFKKGNPIINFQISQQNGLLDPKSISLNYTLRLEQSTSQTQSNPEILLPDNEKAKGGASEVAIKTNERVAGHGIIDTLTFTVLKENSVIESIRNSARYLSTTLPVSHSESDMNTYMSCRSLNASRTQVSAVMMNNIVSCSQRFLQSGFLNGDNLIPIHLFGLGLSMQLVPDSFLLTGTSASTGAFYTIENVNMTYDVLVPDEQSLGQMMSKTNEVFTYESINSVYNTLDSGNNFTNINWGLGAVKSVFSNFLPVTSVNNYAVDSMATPQIESADGVNATIEKVSFSKGGALFPITQELNVKTSSQEERPIVPVLKNGLDAIIPYKRLLHSMISPETQLAFNTMLNGYANGGAYDETILKLTDTIEESTQPNKIFTVGCAMDNFADVGVSFREDTYGMFIKSSHQGSYPVGIYSFAKARNTITVNQGRVSVSS